MVAVKVGNGSLIHAATVTETKKGRHAHRVYKHLCGSGNSTAAHNHRRASVRLDPYSSLNDVTCRKCLQKLEDEK